MRILHRQQAESPEKQTVDGASAFVTGSYARFLQRTEGQLPPWAWLNVLAHGTKMQILEVAVGRSKDLPRGRRYMAWRQAAQFVAIEMLDRSRFSSSALQAMQVEMLQPLEERMMRTCRSVPRTPAQLVAVALSAMAPPSRSERRLP